MVRVNIFQEDLNDFLTLAEEFQFKGLTGIKNTLETEQLEQTNKSSKQPDTEYLDACKDIQVEYNNTHNELSVVSKYTENSNMEYLYETVDSMIEKKADGPWTCTVCGKASNNKTHVREHVEGIHIKGIEHPCNFCQIIFNIKKITQATYIQKNTWIKFNQY